MKKIIWLYRIVMKNFCFAVFGIGSLILGFIVFPVILLLIKSESAGDRFMRKMIRVAFASFAILMRSLGLIRVKWSGESPRLDNVAGSVIVANHPSLIDIVILMSRIPNADCIVKSALFRFPMVRLVVKKLYISNELSDTALIDAGVKSLQSGNTLVIFPEGTRSKGNDMGPVKRGAARIALKAACASHPVRIITSDATGLRKGDSMLSFRKDAAIDFRMDTGQAISSDKYNNLSAAIGARRLTEDYLKVIAK